MSLIVALALPLFAQTEVVHRDDFQSYKTPSNPPGWVDTSIGNPKPEAQGLYKAWNDPLQGNQGPNVVYGTKQSSGKPEGNNPRIGTFSTLTTKKFDAKGRFEYSGRLIRTNTDSRIGLTFLSSYPEVDKYYLIGLWSQPNGTNLTMQLFGFGAGALTGTTDSNLTIDPNKWYRFLIQVDNVDNATKIRARFWPDGTTEPSTFAIDAIDAAPTRLTTGRIGMWAAVKGDAYIDDIAAKSPVDHTPPVITFVDAATQRVLDPAQLALFKTPARIEIRITDDLSTVTSTAKLDGADYVSATPIAADGLHKLVVNAIDQPGNTATATLDLLVDQVPPSIALQIDGAPFAQGAIFDKDVTLAAVINDISTVTTVAALNGTTVTLPQPIAEERVHAIDVRATDQTGNQSSAASSFIVDKTAPEVTILADGVTLGGGESFQTDVTLTWSATDLTFDRIEATLNGAPIASGTKVTAERVHDLVVKAYDKAGHVTTESRRFVLDKTAPEVRVLANGQTFEPGTTFKAPVTFTVESNDTTPTTETTTLDNASYVLGTAIGAEGPHTIKVVVTNAAGLSTTVGPAAFTIDLTPPGITLTESGEPFRDGMKFNRDVNPVATATDNLTQNPLRELFLNGREFPLDTPIAEEKADHSITAKATDDGGNSTSIGPFRFIVDKTKPVVTIVEETTNKPFGADALFARPVRVKITVTDLTQTTIAATLNGNAFDPNTSITNDGTYTVSVVATDEVGWQNEPVTATFTIDQTPPALTFTSHADNAVVGTPTVVLSGNADDAIAISIADAQATIDLTAKTFVSEPVALVEGTTTIVATGTDKAGNTGTAQIRIELDTRAPELAITTPAIDACVDATTLTVTGTVSDPRVESVKINDVVATLANGEFTATVPVDEGKQLLTIVAADALGHLTTITHPVVVDRTAPAIEVSETGEPFTATLFSRTVTPMIRAIDAALSAQPTATLDGAPYASGTPIDAEGSHTLEVTATDCAGHRTTQSFSFTIDRTAPAIGNLNPANGSTVGTTPNNITGTASNDTATVELLGTAVSAAANADGTFALNGVTFAEGTNQFVLRATDRAGNAATVDYSVVVKTAAPIVTILENGTPLEGTPLFNRAVKPEIRVNEEGATLTATLNDAPFTSGTEISADDDYRLKATATDSHGHTGTAEVMFTIDRTAPTVRITFPQSGNVAAEQVEVRGNATNAVAVEVNGQEVPLDANGNFILPTLYLEFGTTRIVAVARDRAGNTGMAEVEVTRDDVRPGIVLTYPTDRVLTNRPTTEVLGRVLSPNPDGVVTIGTQTTPTDPLGAFRLSGYPLVEGDNTITASTKTNANGTNSVSVVVTADFTPPALAILESNQPLNDVARFATEAVLSLQTSDNRGTPTVELVVDGTKVTSMPHTVTATGGHAAVAVARDQAGNETRVERTFFIGATGGGSATCAIDNLDPSNNAVVLSSSTTLLGRTTSAGVKVNDVAANVADGSFRATVELPLEGANTVTLRCTDGAGVAFGDAVTITLNRVTGDPSIEITSPSEGLVTADETITVTGTVGPGVTSADVNGANAVIAGGDPATTRPFTVAGVRLAGGLNILVARGRNAAGRVATASRRVTALREAPSIAISSPISGTITGASKIELAGTYTNLDPSTIAIIGATVTTERTSDTTGTFIAKDVPLVSGEQTLRVTGRDQANRTATAMVIVRLSAGSPSITIASPANNTYFAANAANPFTVSGTFSAAAGATVDVGGTAATIDGSNFTATAPFTTIGNVTTVVARVTEPAGASAIDTVTVNKLTAAPKVIESFPAPNAVEVDAGAAMLVLFSAPMDRASLANSAFRLEDANGTTVTGTLLLDKDVLTFAPAALLTRGARYTLRVTTAAKDLAGTSLDSEWTAPFTVGTSAPSTAPTLAPVSEAFCGQHLAINGTASAGARLQLTAGTLTLTAVADAQGAFTFNYPLSGQSGYALVRVRVIGSDGSLSPAAELTFRVDCAGPQVLNASFDRNTNRLTITYSEPVDVPAGAVNVTLSDGRTVAVNGDVPAEDLIARSFTLTVTTDVRDKIGNRLAAPYTQTFTIGGEQPSAGDGSGFISGEVYDATTGRPLPGASITIEISEDTQRRDAAATAAETAAVQSNILGPLASSPAVAQASRLSVQSFTTTTDPRGRYLVRLPEGAHTIRASMPGYTSVWRQIIVPAGAGIVPIDIRLTKRNDTNTHGGETAITRPVTVSAGKVTAIGAQALTGLLPLGWSPLTSAEVAGDVSNATLTFTVPATTRNLTAVRYDEVRDEWNVLAAVVTITNDKVSLPINAAGAYALVYPDAAPALVGPVLTALAPPANPTTALTSKSFTLDPPVVLPNGRTVARLEVEGEFPSGTAVQAYIDEELRLTDGSRLLDPPFATDLLLYRDLAGTRGVADFHLAPSPRAAQVILEVGFDHIRVVPYPGRLDRGTLIGNEGGRVPGDDKVAVDIPSGATPEPLRAAAVSLTQQDLDAIGTIQGFQIVSGFTLTLQRATTPQVPEGETVAPVELFKPARATFTLNPQFSILNSQFVLVELLHDTSYGKIARLANQIERIDTARATTKTIDRSTLPVDGIVREGRYLLLAADNPIAFATGVLRIGDRLLADARITANALGVAELTRADGIYNIPVLAAPAAPFTLTPRHIGTGDGAAYTHASSPAKDAIVRVDLSLVPQPPTLTSVTVTAANPPAQVQLGGFVTNISLSTGVRATFSPAIDPASITATSITVLDAETGIPVNGNATADGTVAINWALTPGTTLQAGRRYTVIVSPLIKGTSGAQLTSGASYSFTTAEIILNTEVRAERISITIPTEDGVSRVTGSAGALPANWQATVVRREKDFITRYQATAMNDGSFTFVVGNGGDASDRVTMSDLIDLRVVNNAGNLAAIIPLTPFVTEDRRGFVVPAGKAAKFTTADNITVDVAEGTFEQATLVTARPDTKQTFDDIPSLDADVNFAAAFTLDFEGRALKPIEVEIPVPAGVDTANRNFILALKGQSTRGPRLFAVDTLRVVDGKFTTRAEAPSAKRIAANQTVTGGDAKQFLTHVQRKGAYAAVDLHLPSGSGAGWAAVGSTGDLYELHWSAFSVFYVPGYAMVENTVVVIPIIRGLPLTVVGVDATTGIQAFSRTYDPIPLGDPGVTVLPPPQKNPGGPYPVFATPFRVEGLTLNAEDMDIKSIPNFIVKLANGIVTVSSDPADPLPGSTNVELLNVSKGTFAQGKANASLTLAADLDQRIVLLIEQREVDPGSALSVVFNEPIYINGNNDDEIDAFLRTLFTLERAPLSSKAFVDVTGMVRFSVDSGGRRIKLSLGSSLARDSIYKLTLSKYIADTSGGLGSPGPTLGQATEEVQMPGQPPQYSLVGGGKDLHLEIRVRKPGGELASFNLQNGGARDLALNGNVLLVAASEGGLVAYDVADPAKLQGDPTPLAKTPPDGFSAWTVSSDHHGRVYETTLGFSTGELRSYRLEDFLDGDETAQSLARIQTNWRPGYASNMGYTAFLTNRPEGFPRKLQIIVQDVEQTFEHRNLFISATGATTVRDFDADKIKQLEVSLPLTDNDNDNDNGTDYYNQRITVENVTLDMRWSADATTKSPAVIRDIIAGPNDRIRILRNVRTYGLVSHQGYGIGVYDINALESNRSPAKPIGELDKAVQIILTRGVLNPGCYNGPAVAPGSIPDIMVSPDAAVRTEGSEPHLLVYAPDPLRGLLDMKLALPAKAGERPSFNSPTACDRSPAGMVFRAIDPSHEHPRMKALKDAYRVASGGNQPFPHFFSVANYRWRIEAQDNARGERASEPNKAATRDYVLVAGGDLGLLVVEVGGDPAPQPLACAGSYPPGYYPLQHRHLADIVWIPGGALSVRVIPRSDLAVVSSRSGRIHLVDLSRLDERFDDQGRCSHPNALFPTAAACLARKAPYADGVGAEDPRIVWTSDPGIALGIIPPVVDSETGMVYAGQMVSKTMKAIAAIDPRIAMKVDLGQGSLEEVGGIVPHGIDPPKDIKERIDALRPCGNPVPHCKENASLGTFRLEVTLPGAVPENVAVNELQVAIETERVFNAPSEQTPPGFPRSHLRRFRRDGTAEPADRAADHFRLRRVIPDDDTLRKKLRHQRGFNKFVSPWVVALVDPRASSKYVWPSGWGPAEKAAAGCRSCERPQYLANAKEEDGVYELFTNGRLLAVRPELAPGGKNIFAGTKYAYLGEENRLVTRFATILADTVRPPDIRVAAQNPPVAGGAIQDTLFLHSGEYQVGAVDLVPGGRGGAGVVVDRTYRSRTIGGTILGLGWDSSNLRRLRALPSGEVELRDSDGEIWVFTPKTNSQDYDSPPGYFMRLTRVPGGGWRLFDQQWRAVGFDELGRLSFESDEFAQQSLIGLGSSDGNIVRYLYDATGRLAQIVDPVERRTELTYWKDSEASMDGAYPGFLKEVKDWRERTTVYEYDKHGRLIRVKGPEVLAGDGVAADYSWTGNDRRPRTEYRYPGGFLGYKFNEILDFNGNLLSITEPDQVAAPGGAARVSVDYGDTGSTRDRMTAQQWATHESVSVTYTSEFLVSTKDALGQVRSYELSSNQIFDKRAHIKKETVEKVPTLEIVVGKPVGPGLTSTDTDIVTSIFYNDQGLPESIIQPNGLVVSNTWGDASKDSASKDRNGNPLAPGMVLDDTSSGQGQDAIKSDIQYDKVKGPTTAATPVAVKRGNDTRDAQSPSSQRREVEMKQDDDSIVVSKFSEDGLLESVTTQDKNRKPQQATTTSYFKESDPKPIRRQRPSKISTTDDTTQSAFDYDTLEKGGEKVTATDLIRGTVSESHYDSWGRVTYQKIFDTNGLNTRLLAEERSGYDAGGRLVWHSRKQTGVGANDTVVTTIKYDAMGRPTETTMTGAAVGGSPVNLISKTETDLTKRKITEYDPALTAGGGAKTVTTLDTLGRTVKTERMADGQVLTQVTGYDTLGSPSYATDGVRSASGTTYDIHGRPVRSLSSDGILSKTTYTIWGAPEETTVYDAGNAVISRTRNKYTEKGRLLASNEDAGSAGARITRNTWAEGDRELGVRVGQVADIDKSDPNGPVRVAMERFDKAGRKVRSLMGGATGLDVPSKVFSETQMLEYRGAQAQLIRVNEPQAQAYFETRLAHDGLGRVVRSNVVGAGGDSVMEYDEAGNVVSSTSPGMTASTAKYDSRGLVTEATHPGGGTVGYIYDALGNLKTYSDEAGAKTTMEYDGFGRITKTNYPDGTFTLMRYEPKTGLVAAARDRAGQWLSYKYGEENRLLSVHDGDDPSKDGSKLIDYEYDKAGRLTRVRNADAGIAYEGYDLLGRVSVTRTFRYAGGFGLTSEPAELDVHTQKHEWSIHDERSSWTMPAAGTVAFTGTSPMGWVRVITEQRDAASNLTAQSHGGGPLLGGTGRAPGKLSARSRALSAASLYTEYGYADGRGSAVALPPTSGAKNLGLNSARTSYNGATLAGSATGRDVAERIAEMRDLAIGNHLSTFVYDARGRLEQSGLGMTGPASIRPPTVDTYSTADFRSKRTIPPILDPSQHKKLGTAAAAAIEKTSWQATENPNEAHQIFTRQSYLDGMPVSDQRAYEFQGGRRTRDGDWTASFDKFGRLKVIESAVADRRIEYTWGPNDRIVGRTAKRGTGVLATVEDRGWVLEEDGLPAKTTFVWDPIADRLIAIFEEGASKVDGATAESGLLRQYLHGDQAADDPVRVLVKQRFRDAQGALQEFVRTYLPVFDEAGTGSLQAVVGENGNLIERVLYADAYGDAPRYLQGAVIDRVGVEAKKDKDGDLERVSVRIRLSEAIDPAAFASLGGVRLQVVGGTAITPSITPPILADAYTVQWDFGPMQWAALKSAGPAFEVAVTNFLRFHGWGTTPATQAPDWAKQLYGVTGNAATPFALRHSFSEVDKLIAGIKPDGIATTELYAMQNLYLAASSESISRLLTGFKAAPFIEPATRLHYFRARWYDAATGSWLTPDPRGYAAGSSNLYAGFANDPVNHIDPDGEIALIDNIVGCGVSVAIGKGVSMYLGEDYTNTDLALDCAIGFASSGLSSIAKLKHLGRVGRAAVRIGGEAVLDIGGEIIRKSSKGQSYTLGELVKGAAYNQLLGRAGDYVGGRVGKWLNPCRCLSPDTKVATPDGSRELAQLRVGDRVSSAANDDSDPRDTDVDPETWRLVKLRMPILDGTGDVMLVDMLRPLQWIQQVRAAAGYWIDLKIPELALEGTAEVLSIEAVPPIQPGPGRVVLATFEHDDLLLEIKLAGQTEPLRPTQWHLLYSADRDSFVRSGLLQVGEHLRTRDGDLAIESITTSSARQRVRDIEVEYEHVYYAGVVDALSHNSQICPWKTLAEIANEIPDVLAAQKSAKQLEKRLPVFGRVALPIDPTLPFTSSTIGVDVDILDDWAKKNGLLYLRGDKGAERVDEIARDLLFPIPSTHRGHAEILQSATNAGASYGVSHKTCPTCRRVVSVIAYHTGSILTADPEGLILYSYKLAGLGWRQIPNSEFAGKNFKHDDFVKLLYRYAKTVARRF